MFLGRWIGILALYLQHRGKLDCPGGALLSSYLIVLIVLLALIICTMSAIVCVSMRGKESSFLFDAYSFFNRVIEIKSTCHYNSAFKGHSPVIFLVRSQSLHPLP